MHEALKRKICFLPHTVSNKDLFYAVISDELGWGAQNSSTPFGDVLGAGGHGLALPHPPPPPPPPPSPPPPPGGGGLFFSPCPLPPCSPPSSFTQTLAGERGIMFLALSIPILALSLAAQHQEPMNLSGP